MSKLILGHHHGFSRNNIKGSFKQILAPLTVIKDSKKIIPALSIFLKRYCVYNTKPFTDKMIKDFSAELSANGIMPKHVVVHAAYSTNLPSDDKEKRKKSVSGLCDEVFICGQLGIKNIVLHPGTNGSITKKTIKRLVRGLVKVVEFQKANKIKVKILMENIAKKLTPDEKDIFGLDTKKTKPSTKIGSILDIAEILQQCNKKGISSYMGFCLDTAHLDASGYNVTSDGITNTLDIIFKHIHYKYLKVVHFNNNMNPSGSGMDKHIPLHLGGNITLEALTRLMHHKYIYGDKTKQPIFITESHAEPDITANEYISILDMFMTEL
uniref:Xylose isomerase-like TIM barrel domain-containing protein n=1 Tax=viral metagenome TaxID=1070528 RepID=A0A6C0IYM5_9ZZZZ